MIFRVTLLHGFSDRPPLAVQARYRLRDGSWQTWPVAVRPDSSATTLSVDSGRDMAIPATLARCLVAHYASAPGREERRIARVDRADEVPYAPHPDPPEG